MSQSGDWRMTVEIQRSGQPGAYADTEFVVRFKLEYVSFDGLRWEPEEIRNPEVLKTYARLALGGWKYERDDPVRREFINAFSTYLDYVRPVDGEPGVYQARTVTPYTD